MCDEDKYSWGHSPRILMMSCHFKRVQSVYTVSTQFLSQGFIYLFKVLGFIASMDQKYQPALGDNLWIIPSL
jgi:hypothetical protein